MNYSSKLEIQNELSFFYMKKILSKKNFHVSFFFLMRIFFKSKTNSKNYFLKTFLNFVFKKVLTNFLNFFFDY